MEKKQALQNGLTAAMKAQDEVKKRTLRLVMLAIKMAEVETGGAIDDSRILNILQKEVKTREDAIEEAKKASRPDLIISAQEEIEVLNSYLPQQIDQDDLKKMVKEAIKESGATSIRDMGAVMKILIPKLEGRASGKDASDLVRELLQNQAMQ